MKKVIILMVMVGLISTGGFALWRWYDQAQKKEQIKKVVDDYFKATQKVDVKAMYELLTDDFRAKSPDSEETSKIIKERQETLGKILSWKITEVELEDSKASAEVSVKSEKETYTGVFNLRLVKDKWKIDNITGKKATE